MTSTREGRSTSLPRTSHALLAEVLAHPIPHRFGSWGANVHVHLLGEGRYTLRVTEGRGVLLPGHVGSPTSTWVISARRLWSLYASGAFTQHLLAAMQSRRTVTTEVEDLIMLAKCFDHDALRPPPEYPGSSSCSWTELWPAGLSLAHGVVMRRRELADAALDRSRALLDYWRDDVRPQLDDLREFRWLVSTPGGLLAASERRFELVLPGAFNGIAIQPGRVLAFQANDHFLKGTRRGRIVELILRDGHIVGSRVATKGLDNACHQIVFIGEHLFVCETARDRILELDANLRPRAEYHPAGRGHARLASPHINSVLAMGERRYVMCHHSTEWTGRPSEILECDANFEVRSRRVLRGGACHCLIDLDGRVACCLSEEGEVDCEGETIAQLGTGLFARGLAWDGQILAVGGSELPHRSHPRRSGGALFSFDRSGRRRHVLPLPGAPRDIRALPWSNPPL